VPGTGELSVAELNVARLAASGMTNREAAAELFVTVRAVESTLTKVYAKLGVRSRTQLARHPKLAQSSQHLQHLQHPKVAQPLRRDEAAAD
jgi:DNA-binding CsgD family transcriptional regulator